MLNGFLNRGFSSKCKSLIKLTTTRIDVIRKKRNAMQKFLKNDVADLLTVGFDDNAFGKAETLVRELCLSSCYDYIEHSCNCILKHLSDIQKQSDCPEECRMAVASLMFAAARFSDLPELRDLRHIFQERYGNSLQCFANQEFVENLSAKPPMEENKIKLMQEIASEFSIKWDGAAFAFRMTKPPPVFSLNKVKTYGASPSPTDPKTPNTKDDPSPLPKIPIHKKPNNTQEPKPQRIFTIPPPYHKPQPNKTSPDPPPYHKPHPNKASPEPLAPDNTHGKQRSSSSSRRRHGHSDQKQKPKSKPRLGLQLLADDQRDEDERMLDKLLVHYSHKQPSYDPEKVRDNLESNPHRSKSLPPLEEEAPKVFSRVASLERAGHLHPKLPDYDVLVAKLAAMKVSNKD